MNSTIAKFEKNASGFFGKIKEFCIKHKKLVWSIVLTALVFLCCMRQAELVTLHKYKIFMTALGIGLTFIFALSIFLLDRKKLILTYIVLGMFFGLVYMFMLPIFNVPDEDTHFISAYELSNEMMGVESSRDDVVMRKVDYELADNHDRYDEQMYLDYFHAVFDGNDDETLMATTAPTLDYLYPYFFSSMGISIARKLNMSPIALVTLGRLFNMIVAVLIIALAIYFMPFGKQIMVVIALSPKLIQQDMSLSYDSCFIPLSFLVTGLGFYLIYHEKGEKENKIVLVLKYILWIFAYIGMTLIKGHAYFAFILLLFPYFRHRVKNKKKFDLIFTFLVIAVIVIGLIALPHTAFYNQKENFNTQFLQYGFTLQDFIKNPSYFLEIVRNTVFIELPMYCHNMLGALIGHFTISLNGLVVDGFILTVIASAIMNTGENKKLSNFETFIAFLIAFITICCTFAGMLFGWTLQGAKMIDGIQGRYFIPVLTIELLMFYGRKIHIENLTVSKLVMFETVLQILTVEGVFGGY